MMTSGSFAKSLYPGVSNWYGQAYEEWSPQWPELVDQYTTKRAYEEDVQYTGFGLLGIKPEGSGISYDDAKQGFITRYNPVVYGLGFVITREAVEDDLYGIIGPKRAKALAFSVRQTKEQVVANMYNRAFNSAYAGGDGKELLATDHPFYNGGSWANELTTAADLSEAALEQACIDIAKLKNDRGLNISLMGESLIISVDQMFEAHRLLQTPYRIGTSDNDISALYSMGKFPGGVKVNHYLTDTDAWFIRTNLKSDGLKYFQRRKAEFTMDNEWETENAKYKVTERYSTGWTDARALFGSPGA